MIHRCLSMEAWPRFGFDGISSRCSTVTDNAIEGMYRLELNPTNRYTINPNISRLSLWPFRSRLNNPTAGTDSGSNPRRKDVLRVVPVWYPGVGLYCMRAIMKPPELQCEVSMALCMRSGRQGARHTPRCTVGAYSCGLGLVPTGEEDDIRTSL